MNERVLRWAFIERVEHLLIVVLLVAFIITGLSLFNREWFGWMVLPPVGLDLFRQIHRLAAGVYVALGFFHVLYHTAASRPTRIGVSTRDLTDSIKTIKYYSGVTDAKPKIGFHNPAEKIVSYWLAAVVFMISMGASGILLMFPEAFPVWLHEWALVTHDIFFILIVVALMFHFYMALLYHEHKPLLDAMFTDGMIPAEYVKENHLTWYEELDNKK